MRNRSKRLGPNSPCPCGRVDDEGKTPKFKRCCGNITGDVRYVVANTATGDMMSDEKGQVLLFLKQAHAQLADTMYKWSATEDSLEVLTLAEARWKDLVEQVPCRLITSIDIDTHRATRENPIHGISMGTSDGPVDAPLPDVLRGDP